MKIEFQNFGAIKRGQMELAPLTLLCGANNTSKTYALYAIYGLLQKTAFWNFSEWESLHLSEAGTTNIELDVFLRQHWTKLQNDIGAQFTKSLPGFFATEEKSFGKAKISFQGDLEATLEIVRRTGFKSAILSHSDYNSLWTRKEQGSFEVSVSYTNHSGEKDMGVASRDEDFSRVFSKMILGMILQPGWSGDDYGVFLLPAERGGLNLFYSELNARRTAQLHFAFSQKKDSDLPNNSKISRYPLPIAHYIDFLNNTSWIGNEKSELADLAVGLQKEIVGGNYSLDRSGSIVFRPRNTKTSLDLHLSSSTAKSYFALSFYLQHMAQKGDVLMIDEPELNLHPDNQRRIARIFARMIGRGIRIVLSTHSDYLVREINNLIVMGHDFPEREALRERYGYIDSDFLRQEDVRAYSFGENGIEEMEKSPDEGIIAETFDRVINDLNGSSYELASAWAQFREEKAGQK